MRRGEGVRAEGRRATRRAVRRGEGVRAEGRRATRRAVRRGRGRDLATDVGCGDPAGGNLARELEGALREAAREGLVARFRVRVRERPRGGTGDRAELGSPGGLEDPRHLGEPPRPEPARRRRELALDDAVDDRRLALGLDLVGDDEAALARLEELEGVGLHGLGIEEPARRLRKVEQLGAARDARGVHRRRRGRRLRDAHVLEEAPPARERGGRRRAVVAVERQRLGAEGERARRIRLDPRQLLGGAQRLELALEPLLRDVTARRVHDADGVVDDQRAEARAAEAALEEHPRGARAAAVDTREPRTRGSLRAGLDDGSTPGAGRRRDAALGEPIEGAPRGPTEPPLAARREGGEGGQRLGPVVSGEGAERRVERVLVEVAQALHVERRRGHPKLSRKNGCCGGSAKWTLRAYSRTPT